ncbi:MAG: MFS transporter [Planctomycetota bacterium]|nr:MFS transporter [Planctomycetota bacterium]
MSDAKRQDRRTVWAWCLYDFGNSSFAVLFASMYSVYYTAEIVQPTGQPADAWWSATIASSMLLVALSAPFVGGIADHTGRRKRLLAIYTGIGVVAVLALTLVGPGGMGMVVLGAALAALANVGFEGGLVFYNAYLPDIAPPDRRGRVSALGFAVGYAGSLVALGLAWPLLEADLWEWMWVAIAVQWVVFAIPTFRRLPADVPTGVSMLAAAGQGVRQTLATIKDVWGMPHLRRFLIAFFVYMDGVITVVFFAARYATETLKFTGVQTLGMLAIVQITALIGSVVMGPPTDRLGPRFTVRIMLVWWVGVAIAAYLAEEPAFFLVVAGLAGLGLGSIQAASRAFMARLIPAGRESELFGFYALCGKTGSILGPVTFGVITVVTGSQRPAVLAVAAFYLVGLLLLKGVRDDPAVPDPASAVS